MGCGPNDPGFAVRFEVEASGLSFSSASRRTVGPTQPPLRRVQTAVSL